MAWADHRLPRWDLNNLDENIHNSQRYYSLIPPGNYSNMIGEWFLKFDVLKGEAIILIEKVDNWKPLYLSYR